MRQRLDITDVEAQTKIRAKYLRALENEDFGMLPGSTFVKSFLRTYAEFLGLDPQLLVEEYRARHDPRDESELTPFARPPSGRQRRRPPRPPGGVGAGAFSRAAGREAGGATAAPAGLAAGCRRGGGDTRRPAGPRTDRRIVERDNHHAHRHQHERQAGDAYRNDAQAHGAPPAHGAPADRPQRADLRLPGQGARDARRLPGDAHGTEVVESAPPARQPRKSFYPEHGERQADCGAGGGGPDRLRLPPDQAP